MSRKRHRQRNRNTGKINKAAAPKDSLTGQKVSLKTEAEKAGNPPVIKQPKTVPLIDATEIKGSLIKEQEPEEATLTEFLTKHKLIFQIVLFILFTLFLVSADAWLETERKVFDWLTFFNSTPNESQQVVIVKIDENDFSHLFEKKSPLKPTQVTNIIEAISKGGPKVLGIDILTSDESHSEYIPKDYGFPIVWANEPIKKGGKFVEIKPPLFGKQLPRNNSPALPESAKDADGVNRIFRRKWKIEGREYPTFAWEIYKLAYPKESKLKEEDIEDHYINFTGNSQPEITAGEILRWDDDIKKEHLAGKIVLLGGMYGDARDTQLVPFESIFGVQLNAAIIETEIQGNPQQPISGIWKFILNMIAFPFFAIIFFRYNFLKALFIAFLIILFALISLSFFKYGISSLTLLIPVFLWTLFLALLDLAMDKYKETGSEFFELGKHKFQKFFHEKKT